MERTGQWFVDRNHAYYEWRRAIREHGNASEQAKAAHAEFEKIMQEASELLE
jgi:hypothetical protein